MARKRNLEQESLIFRLQSRGLGVRAIARELKISASTVSRVLQREPSKEQLAQLTGRVESVEGQLKFAKQCIAILSKVTVQFGPHYRQELLGVLMKWPGGEFRELYDRNQI
jgi:hypothetical protein